MRWFQVASRMEHRGEPGHVARRDGLEAGADDVDVGGGGGGVVAMVCAVMVCSSQVGWVCSGATLGGVGHRGHRLFDRYLPSGRRLSELFAARPWRMANIARPARVETPHLA